MSSIPDFCARNWRGSGGDAHDRVRSVGAVAKVAEGNFSPELLNSSADLVE